MISSWRRPSLDDPALHQIGRRTAVVAFQGERGAYAHLAIESVWGDRAWVMPAWTFERVVQEVRSGSATYGVLPVHNVIVGEIPGVQGLIEGARLLVAAEVTVPVRHCLLGVAGSTMDEVREACSHPVALQQCRGFFDRFPAIAMCEGYDTAGCAREVSARGRRWQAAIADGGCAERYGLHMLARDIGDRADNATRFALVTRNA